MTRDVEPAGFDSCGALVNALSAVLRDVPFRHLGQSAVGGRLTRAADRLPGRLARTAYEIGGQREALRPHRLDRVSAQGLARWVVARYPVAPVDTVFVGSSNGALMHLAAAMRVPWLPQTFLLPVRRRADPEDPRPDLELQGERIAGLLDREPDLMLHQMHDPNQDRLMLGRMAYLRFKLRALPPAYRDHLRRVLAPGGRLVLVDCTLRQPVIGLGPRHVFQPGALGGLRPETYLSRWDYPTPDREAPEAEWGFCPDLAQDVLRFARLHGYRVSRLTVPHPDTAGPPVADTYRAWYADAGVPDDRLLIETFISVEPFWALATRTVPLWTTFPVRDSLEAAARYLDAAAPWREIAVTLFAHGTRSEGLAGVEEWQQLAGRAGQRGWLAGVDARRWPLNLAALDRYADELHRARPAALLPTRPLPWARASRGFAGHCEIGLEEIA